MSEWTWNPDADKNRKVKITKGLEVEKKWRQEAAIDLSKTLGLDASLASDYRDKKHCTDLQVVMLTPNGPIVKDVAYHVYRWRDRYEEGDPDMITIRYSQKGNTYTELAKLKEGYSHWFYFNWLGKTTIESNGKRGTYRDIRWKLLLDSNKLRKSGLLDTTDIFRAPDAVFLRLLIVDIRDHDIVLWSSGFEWSDELSSKLEIFPELRRVSI